MKRKTDTTPNKRKWAIYLSVGALLLAGVAFFSGKNELCLTEERFDQTLDFIKSQSTSYEKYNDIVTAKALRHETVSVHQLADDPTLDLSDSQCLEDQAEALWLTGISVLDSNGALLCEYTADGVGYAQLEDQLKRDTVLDALRYPQKTYVKQLLLEDGSAVDVAVRRSASEDVVLLAYRHTSAEFVTEGTLSVQSVLDGYSEETSGTLFMVQNNRVVASNQPELIGRDVADSPLVQEIRGVGTAGTLTHAAGWDGSGCYFGMYSHGRSFDLYAYTDEKTVFSNTFAVTSIALVSYALLVSVLQILRARSTQAMERQNKKKEAQYQAQLEEQNRRLEIALQHEGAANRAKREFLFNMSHDIRTPMNAMIGITTLIDHDADSPEKVHEYVRKIRRSNEYLLGIINDVLDMSRIESGKTVLNVGEFDIRDIVDQIDAAFRSQTKERRH